MVKKFKKINKNKFKKTLFSGVFALVLFSSFILTANVVWAGEGEPGIFAQAIAAIAAVILNILGKILVVGMRLVVWIAQYNGFIDSPVVINGWVVIRDLCNMFFILILLVIAFATILRRESYNMKKWLPRLLVMAVLINFSKTICGLIIDAGQVVMLSFVQSFKDVGGGNLAGMLGIGDLATIRENSAEDVKAGGVAGAYLLAILYVLIAIVVIFTMVAVLAWRVVMLWVYVVLSPLAYLLASFPQGESYSRQWWSDFTKHVIVGPVLAFFIWLSFISANSDIGLLGKEYEDVGKAEAGQVEQVEAAMTESGTPAYMIKFVMAIAMLMGGLVVSQQIGGKAGAAAGMGMGAIQGGKAWATRKGKGALKWTGKKGLGTAKAGGKIGLATASGIDRYAARKMGKDGRKGLVGGAVTGVRNLPGNFLASVQKRFTKNEDLNKVRREIKGKRAGYQTSYKGKNYKKSRDGRLFEVDSEGKAVMDQNNKPKFLQHKDKDVREMGDARASFRDSWRDVNSGSRAASYKAQEEAVNKEQQKMADANMDPEELRNVLKDKTASQEKKMAAALTLAIKKGFKDRDQVDRAKNVLGSNTMLLDKFKDEMDKGQTHLAYDFDKDEDKEEFKSRIDSGKIDSTKLPSEAYKDNRVVNELQNYHGKDFKRIMETAYKRGSKYEKTVGKGVLEAKKQSSGDDWNKMANLHAKLTGKIQESFKDAAGQINENSMGEYVKTAKATDLNNIEVDNVRSMNTSQKRAIAQNMSYGQLKSMYKSGEKPELVRELRDLINDHGRASEQQRVSADNEGLSTY